MASSRHTLGVPLIDASQFLSLANADATPPQHVVQQVAEACRAWGFFQLINHGVDGQLLQKHLEATKRFFQLPLPVKEAVARGRDNAMGFNANELTKQKLDIKQVFDFRVLAHQELPDDHPDNFDPSGINQWPEGQDEFRQINQQFAQELSRLSFKLLEVLALALGLAPDALHPLFRPSHSSRIRLNYYPVVTDAAPGSFGVSHHKDSGFLTVLLQDEHVPGLQVLHYGKWHMVEPVQGAFTVNVGDMLQVLSNDTFIAANHRVLQSSIQARLSRVFFFNPSQQAEVQPMLAAGSQPHYRPISWKQWYLLRLDGNYADLGAESQIDWYRIDRAAAVTASSELGQAAIAAAPEAAAVLAGA